MYSLIDTHAHLDELEDLEARLNDARGKGVVAIVAVGSDYQSNLKTLEISRKYRSFVYPALGLHPWQLSELPPSRVNDELKFIEENIAAATAVGEIGLDYHKKVVNRASREFQKEVLARLLELAREYDKPVSLHTRYAWKDAFQLVRDAGVTRAVFHWFTGFSSVLRDIISAGYFISVTPAAEYHEEHRRAVRETPVDRLLLETDCPVYYGRETRYRSVPADVVRSLDAAARIKEIDRAVIAEQTTRNAIELFSLKAENAPDYGRKNSDTTDKR